MIPINRAAMPHPIDAVVEGKKAFPGRSCGFNPCRSLASITIILHLGEEHLHISNTTGKHEKHSELLYYCPY